jgi:hypothetical protein
MRYLAPVNQQNDKLTVVGISCVCFALIACLFIFVSRADCQSTDTVNQVTSGNKRDYARINPSQGTYARASISSGGSHFDARTSVDRLAGFSQYNLGGFNGLPAYRMFSVSGSGWSMLMSKAEIRQQAKHRLLPLFAEGGNTGNSFRSLMPLPSMWFLPSKVRVPELKGDEIYSGGFDHVSQLRF